MTGSIDLSNHCIIYQLIPIQNLPLHLFHFVCYLWYLYNYYILLWIKKHSLVCQPFSDCEKHQFYLPRVATYSKAINIKTGVNLTPPLSYHNFVHKTNNNY